MLGLLNRLSIKRISCFGLLLSVIFYVGCGGGNNNPTNPPAEDEVIIPETTKILKTTDLIANLISVSADGQTYTFNSAILSNYAFKGGDVMVSSRGEGFLRKITNIQTANDQVIIQTSQASITDAVEQGNTSFELDLTKLQLQKVNHFVPGITITNENKLYKGNQTAIEATIDLTVWDQDGDPNTASDQVNLDGQFSMEPVIDGDVKIGFFSLKHLELNYGIIQNLELELKVGLASLVLQKEQVITQLTFQSIIVTIGTVPIVLTPVLEFVAGVELDINSTVTTGISQHYSTTFTILYENSNWSQEKTVEKSFDLNQPVLTANASAMGYLKPQFKLKIYGFIAPQVAASIYGEILADVANNPWWEIYAGLNLSIGVDAQILDKTIFDFNADLYDLRNKIGDASNYNTPPTASFTVTPSSGNTSTTFQFDASGSSDNEDSFNQLRFSWDWENDGVWDIENSTTDKPTHRYSTQGTKTIKLRVNDTGGLTNTTTREVSVASSNTPPIASFTVSPTSGTTETVFSFEASGSVDAEDPTSALQVRWDWENDGFWDTAYTTVKTATHQYPTPGTRTIRLEVMDSSGLTNVATDQVTVTSGFEFEDSFEYTDSVTNHGWQFIPFGDDASVFTTSDKAFSGSRSLYMDSADDDEQRITHSFATLTNVRVEVYIYDGLNQSFGFNILHTGNSSTHAMIGFRSPVSNSHYSTEAGTLGSWSKTSVQRMAGWQKLTLEVTPVGVNYYINDSLVRSSGHLTSINFVQLMCGNHGYGKAIGTVYFDDVIVYKVE